MSSSRWALCLLVSALLSAHGWSQPYGLSNRVGNTTLRLPPTPPASSFAYATTNAFGDLAFTDPVAIVAPPGETNRLFIVEQPGRIAVITNLANPNRTVFMDISARVRFGGEQGLLGLAFHPNYRDNRQFFVFYTINTNGNQSAAGDGTRHDRLSRFLTSASNPNQGLANSEVVLFNQRDEASNHNGGDLHFGPDGYLYVALGDEGGGNDNWNNSQRIDANFFAGLLRIDVDKRPGNLAPNPHNGIVLNGAGEANYAVPADNPWVGATSFNGQPVDPTDVRTEFWAVGLRNPWRFSFDPATGILYCGDVGQDRWEEIDIITRGGNYGWVFREGRHDNPDAGRPRPAGFTSIDPIAEYGTGGATNQGDSVTGGVVYRGSRLGDLDGHYVFADYVSGHIWALRYDGGSNAPMRYLTSDNEIACFGIDPATGDVLMGDLGSDRIKRLVVVGGSGSSFPQTLDATGAFADLATLTPAVGLVGYDLNLPFWSDHAEKTRWVYIPTNRTISFRATNNWTFPTGSVWVKHFELELTNGVPESRRRLETRFLVRDSAQGAYGVTYRWDDAQTNATLVPAGGLDETFLVYEGDTVRTQVWHYPGRTECLECHTGPAQGGLALGFNTAQLNRDFLYPNGVTDNQLRSLQFAGYFSGNPAVPPLNTLRALAHPTNEAASVEQRVRSYLAANCAFCHQPGGSAQANFDARLFRALSQVNLVNGPLVNPGGNASNRVVVPGSLEHSMLLARISIRGAGQMPPRASTVVDTQAVALVSRWITDGLAGYQSFADWQMFHFGSTNAPAALPGADPDDDRGWNALEHLTGTDPQDAASAWGIGIEVEGDGAFISYPRLPNRGFEVQWRTNSDLGAVSGWRFLDVPENRPFFSATNGVTRVPVSPREAASRFYRVRVYEP